MKYSVIVPYYRESEAVLDACRASIRSAITDAGLTVDVEILEEYGADGVSTARNRGLEKSTGEWLLFVDADDTVDGDWLIEIANAIDENPNADMIAWGETEGAALWAGLWNKAYRRKIIPVHGFRPYAHGEDRLFLLESLLAAGKIAFVKKNLYNYRPTQFSVTKRPRDLRWVLDTLGYSSEMLAALDRYGKGSVGGGLPIPKRLYHDIAVWTLEECSFVKLGVPEWMAFLPKVQHCRKISLWYRTVAFLCRYCGIPAQFFLCVIPRALKRWISHFAN